MNTKIYKTYSDFYNREDKDENGVSESFADNNSTWEKMNATNKACWNCSYCRDCSDCRDCGYCRDCSDCSDCSDCRDCSYCSGCRDCSDCSDCRDCSYCSDCRDCSGCRDCSDCRDCSGCRDCSDCSDCSGCSDCRDKKGDLTFPVIENIHAKVLEAVTQTDQSLNMSTWHTCDTTHCRAGWVVTLAGEAGLELEKKTSTAFAASLIYKVSSPIRVYYPRFYENDEQAMADIKRCAEEEAKLIPVEKVEVVEELTMEEVCKLLGKTIKIKK